MLATDRVAGVALILFALLVIWESRSYPIGTFRQPGPAFIPILIGLLLLIFGVLVTVASRPARSFTSVGWGEWRHTLAILAAAVFSGLAIERLGYRLTVLLMLAFLVQIVERRGWVQSLAFAFTLAFGSFFLFYSLLRVPLPQGPLGF